MGLFDITVTIFLIVLFVNIIINRLIIKEPRATLTKDMLPTISVLIPTRNEAGNISRCLRALLAQDHPRFEVIVLDDSSTDNTTTIVNDHILTDNRIKLIKGRKIAPHWLGKTYSQYQAAQASRGKYLLFLDADVKLDRRALSLMVSAAKRRGVGIVSLLPYQDKEGFWEGLLAPFKYFHLFLLFPTFAMDWPWEALVAFANGQCMMIERETYKKIGGHNSASESIREGVALARELKKRGGKIRLLSGAKIARAKFHGKPPALWDGLTRFLYSMADRSLVGALLMAVLYTIIFVLPVMKILYTVFTVGFETSLLVSVAHILLGIIMFFVAVGSFGLKIGQALLFPLGAAVWVGMILRAMMLSMAKEGIMWKGRTVKLP